MNSEFVRQIEIEDSPLHDETAVDAALAHLPAPRSPDVLLARFLSLGVAPENVVVDLGCGHGQYAPQIAAATGCTVVALDLSGSRVRETQVAAIGAEAGAIHVARGLAEALPLRAGSVDFIWCRDMLPADLRHGLGACANALKPGGSMLVYHTFATDLLEPLEAERIYKAFAIVAENMDPGYFEQCAQACGFEIIDRDAIGPEWRERMETIDTSSRTAANLVRAARLLRAREDVTGGFGEDAYEFAMADQLWGIYQMIGKLCPTVYVLRRS